MHLKALRILTAYLSRKSEQVDDATQKRDEPEYITNSNPRGHRAEHGERHVHKSTARIPDKKLVNAEHPKKQKQEICDSYVRWRYG